MRKIQTIDSLIIILSSGPITIHKFNPLYSRYLAAETESDVTTLQTITYDTVYEAYDLLNTLVCQKISDSNTKITYQVTPSHPPILNLNLDQATLLGRFISKEELEASFPEYFI